MVVVEIIRGNHICKHPQRYLAVSTNFNDSITEVREDPQLLTTHLVSQPVEWSKIATNYKLSFGNHQPLQPSIRGRQITNPAVESLLRKRDGKSQKFHLGAGVKGKETIFKSDPKQLETCNLVEEKSADFCVAEDNYRLIAPAVSSQETSRLHSIML